MYRKTRKVRLASASTISMPQFVELVNKLVNKEMRCFRKSAFPAHLAVGAPVSVYPAD